MKRDIDDKAQTEDWFGNNIALTCPNCGKVYVVSGFLKEPGNEGRGERSCPNCGKSKATVHGSKREGGSAFVVWD
jgi:transcription elongation factor Elf1